MPEAAIGSSSEAQNGECLSDLPLRPWKNMAAQMYFLDLGFVFPPTSCSLTVNFVQAIAHALGNATD